MLRRFERTDGAFEWIDDRHVTRVWGVKDSVKIDASPANYGPYKGTVEDIARTLNGFFDD